MKVIFDNICATPIGDIDELELWKRIFSFKGMELEKDENYKSGEWDGIHKLYEEPSLRVPAGLVLFYRSLIEETFGLFLKYENFPESDYKNLELSDINPFCLDNDGELFELRDYQLRTIHKIMVKGGGVIHMGTGGGKTEVAAGLYAHIGVKTLFVSDSTGVSLNQTYFRFLKRGFESVGRIGDGHFDLDKDLTVGEIPTLLSRIRKGDEGLLEFLDSVEMIIFDETHRLPAQSWNLVGQVCDAKIRVGLSGTPFLEYEKLKDNTTKIKEITSSSLRDLKIIGIVGDLEVVVPSWWLVDKGYLARPIIKFVRSPKLDHGISSDSWRHVYEHGIINNTRRNQLIVTIAYTMFCTQKRSKVIIQVDEWIHAINILKLLISLGIESEIYGGGSTVLQYDPEYLASTKLKITIRGKRKKEVSIDTISEKFVEIIQTDRVSGIMNQCNLDPSDLSNLIDKIQKNQNLEKNELKFLSKLGYSCVSNKVGYDHYRPSTMGFKDFISKYQSLDRFVLISSPVIDTSFDLSEIDTLIPAAGKKSPIKVIQRLGRGMRLQKDQDEILYFDFIDGSHYYLNNHSKARMNKLVEQGHEVKSIEVTPRFDLYWCDRYDKLDLVKYYQKIFLN